MDVVLLGSVMEESFEQLLKQLAGIDVNPSGNTADTRLELWQSNVVNLVLLLKSILVTEEECMSIDVSSTLLLKSRDCADVDVNDFMFVKYSIPLKSFAVLQLISVTAAASAFDTIASPFVSKLL